MASRTILSIDVGIKNLAYCRFTYLPSEKRALVDDINIIDLSENDNVDIKDTESLVTSLIKKVRGLFDGLDLDVVVIENQPVLKNPVMKTLQVALYTMFLQRRVLSPNDIGAVRLYSASNKLKLGKLLSKDEIKEIEERPDIAKITTAYNRRKKLSVAFTRSLIDRGYITFADEVQRQRLEGKAKADDMCDALLQGVHFATSAL